NRKTGETRPIPTWWISISCGGKRIRVSSHSDKRSVAMALLRQKLAELGVGRAVGRYVDRTTFEVLATIIENDYKANGRRLARSSRASSPTSAHFFGMDLARDITSDRITAYAVARLEEAKAATTKRELAALKRALRLAHRAGRVANVPHISLLHEAD